MSETPKKKKSSIQGKKIKKGSPAKRSFFFKPATIILALLATLLLGLGILYQARDGHWLSRSTVTSAVKEAHNTPVVEPLKRAVVQTPPSEEESHIELPGGEREDHEVLIREEDALIAIIVDDLGADLGILQDFLDLHLNLTASILPNVPHTRASAELAHASGLEVLLHLPMEPRNYPTANPGVNALMIDLPKEEVQQRLRDYLQVVPWAMGANNHMGSRFTESSEGMRVVLQTLKNQKMFFVDSLTTANSVAIAEAEQMLIPHAERDLFLDNVQSEEAIRQQIRQLIKIAKKQGSAIGICHPHIATVAALKKEAASFTGSGVQMVGISRLIHQ